MKYFYFLLLLCISCKTHQQTDNSKFKHKNDSIPNTTILVKGKPVYNLTRKSFEKEIGKFETITTDSILGYSPKITKSYNLGLNNTTYYFDQNYGLLTNIEIEIPYFDLGDDYPDEDRVIIDGISVGKPQQILFTKYPNTKKFKNSGIKRSKLNPDDYYTVLLNNNTGHVTYYIKDKIVNRIRIEFNYPR